MSFGREWYGAVNLTRSRQKITHVYNSTGEKRHRTLFTFADCFELIFHLHME